MFYVAVIQKFIFSVDFGFTMVWVRWREMAWDLFQWSLLEEAPETAALG